MKTFTLQEYMDSWVMYSWDDKTIRFMRNTGNRREPYLTCFGIKEVPKGLLNHYVQKVVHVEHNVFEFWLNKE